MVFLSHAISDARIEEEKDECGNRIFSSTIYGTRWAIKPIPRYELPEEEMPPEVAYKLIKDALL
ncbi:13186_t:CDS:2, partial [Acaulospora morrowiae]